MRLTKSKIEEISQCIRTTGLTHEEAALLAGVSTTNYRIWVARSREPRPGIYRELVAAMNQATADFKAFHVNNLKRCSITAINGKKLTQ